jgi:hypothetical protein
MIGATFTNETGVTTMSQFFTHAKHRSHGQPASQLIGCRWRTLPPDDLEDLIEQIRRTAVHEHLTLDQWKVVDRMRGRAAKLKTEMR